MRQVISTVTLSFALGAAAFAADQQAEQTPAEMMQPATPSEEVRALAPLFGRSWAWTTAVPVEAMGPGSKAMTANARADCRPISRGFAYSCLINIAMGKGKEAMKYAGHLVIGYDTGAKEFRAFSAFDDGSAMPMRGTLEGKKFTLESTTDIVEQGRSMRERLMFDFSDPNNVKFTEAHKVAGGDWQVLTESTMKPVPAGRARRGPVTP